MSLSIKSNAISKPAKILISAAVLAGAGYFILYGLGIAKPLF